MTTQQPMYRHLYRDPPTRKEALTKYRCALQACTDVREAIMSRFVMMQLNHQLPDDVLRNIMSFLPRTGSISDPLSFYERNLSDKLLKLNKFKYQNVCLLRRFS